MESDSFKYFVVVVNTVVELRKIITAVDKQTIAEHFGLMVAKTTRCLAIFTRIVTFIYSAEFAALIAEMLVDTGFSWAIITAVTTIITIISTVTAALIES